MNIDTAFDDGYRRGYAAALKDVDEVMDDIAAGEAYIGLYERAEAVEEARQEVMSELQMEEE